MLILNECNHHNLIIQKHIHERNCYENPRIYWSLFQSISIKWNVISFLSSANGRGRIRLIRLQSFVLWKLNSFRKEFFLPKNMSVMKRKYFNVLSICSLISMPCDRTFANVIRMLCLLSSKSSISSQKTNTREKSKSSESVWWLRVFSRTLKPLWLVTFCLSFRTGRWFLQRKIF